MFKRPPRLEMKTSHLVRFLPWKWTRLLRLNVLNFSHFPEFHVATDFRPHIMLWGRTVSLHERMKNVNKNGLENLMFCQQRRICMATDVAHTCAGEFCTAVLSVRVTFGQQNTSYGSSRQPSALLWVAATVTRYSAWHSVHESGSI
jgi:hypothetical protein